MPLAAQSVPDSDVGREQHALDTNAGMTRRLAARADRGQMPSVARPAEKDVADEQNDDQRRRVDRDAKNA